MSSFNFNYLLKFIVIGDSSVGKSNILLRYTQNEFNQEYQSTIGVEFGAKNIKINNKIYRIQIWDTAGQENFRSITRAYYKNSVCALVVYDITKRESFENVQSWIQDCRNQSPKTIIMVLVLMKFLRILLIIFQRKLKKIIMIWKMIVVGLKLV